VQIFNFTCFPFQSFSAWWLLYVTQHLTEQLFPLRK